MKLTNYLKDKFVHIILFFCLLISIEIVLILFDTVYTLQVFIHFLLILFVIIIILYDYNRKKSFYNDMKNKLDSLDDKFLIIEMLERPTFIEGKYLYDSLVDICKSMNDKIEEYVRTSNELKRYIETWVHEIKTPIASAKLILENDNSNLSERINYEMKRVEGFIEQVLYYARSNDVSKDYIIKEFSLRSVVMKSVKSNSRDFINKNIKLDIRGIEGNIFSDEKWVEFIINQIIINAVKFSIPNEGKVSIYSKVILF